MLKDELIKEVQDTLSFSKSLPLSLGSEDIERLIRLEEAWFYDNYHDAVEKQYYLLPKEGFQKPEFKSDRYVKMPDCVISVYECKEMQQWFSFTYNDYDFSDEKFLAMQVYLSPYNGDDMVIRTAYAQYQDLMRAFVNEHIRYDYNKNTKRLKIMGRDPKRDVYIETYVKIPEQYLYDDIYFRRMIQARAKEALGNLLGRFNFNLGGGIQINADALVSEGKEEAQELMEKINAENVPLWLDYYH